jgi:hypothetical protein
MAPMLSRVGNVREQRPAYWRYGSSQGDFPMTRGEWTIAALVLAMITVAATGMIIELMYSV